MAERERLPVRTFVAIDFDEAIRRRLALLQERLRPRCPSLRWVSPAKIHLTLKFIGEIDAAQVVPIGHVLDEAAHHCLPFDITVEQVGAFGEQGPVRVVWVGIKDADGALARCHDLCERLLEPLGIRPETRRFRPHLTLARNRATRHSQAIRRAIEPHKAWAVGIQAVDSLTFYESVATSGGQKYQPLSRHVFGAEHPGR